MPLHPLVVHFPIVLAVLIPFAIIIAALMSKNSENLRALWTAVLVLSVLLSATAFLSMQLGEQDEEVVEKVVAEATIENHEKWGEKFAYATLATLLFTGLLVAKNNSFLKAAAIASSLAVLALGVKTGHSGGELVYKHSAAQAYTSQQAFAQKHFPTGATKGEHNDDDD